MWYPRTVGRRWVIAMERATIRATMIVLGLVLMVAGLAMGVTMIMLPPGIAIGLAGVGLLVWGVVGDVPIDQ